MKRFLTLLLFVCFSVFHANAQTTAQISGTVQDSSGAAVAAAQVQVSNVDTNAIRTVQTSEDGGYNLPNLPIGPYKLQVTKEGFVTYAQTGIVLQVNSNPTINVTLQVGAVTQTVEVTANAAMVETQSTAGLGQVIQPEQVVDLPLNGRQATQLIALSGAAVSNGNQGNLEYPTAVSFSIAGSQGNTTNYYLDGSLDMDYRTNIGEPMPFPDALQEFKVEASALPANLGSRPGGSVNAAVKSGTNSFHGDAFDFLRNTVMDADQWRFVQNNGKAPAAAPTGDNLKRNQFGGTIGGPIIKNKVFFFYGYQGTRERVLGAPLTANVPTAATLAGDFRAMLNSNPANGVVCQSKPVLLNAAYATSGTINPVTGATVTSSNILLPSLLTTPSAIVAVKMAAFLPTTTDPCGAVAYNTQTSDDENQSVMRFDWQRNQNDTVFARYFITNYTLLPYYLKSNLLTAANPGLADRVQSVDFGDTHVFSPQVISSLRVAFLRTATVRTSAAGIPTWTQLGSNVTSQIGNFTGQDSVTGYFGLSIPGFPGYDYENTFEISESIEWTHGAHQMSFGVGGEHVQMNNDGLFQVNANFTWSGSITNNALADYITGNPSTFRQGNGQLGRDSQNMPNAFFQDNWRVTRRFQVNAGVRWDPFIPQYTRYKQASDFSLAGYKAGTVSSVFPNAPPGVTFPGDNGFNGKSDTSPHIWNFAPRIGLVWDPRGNGRETIRAGYGVFWDTSVLWNTMHIVLNPPWGLTLSSTPIPQFTTANPDGAGNASLGTLANPWFNPAGTVNPFPSPLNPPSSFAFPPHGTYVFENQASKPNNVQQWNLSFQKQFGANWLISASYLGSKTTHQWLGQNVDPSVLITAGMTSATFPGIVTNNVGTTGDCTLLYAGTPVKFPVCNGNGTTSLSVNGVTNNNARRLLNLLNPTATGGTLFDGGNVEDFSNGNAGYNGLLASVQHRISQNFSILANFTWSHCMDQGEIGQDIGNAFQNPSNRKADWGNCTADRRKIFNLSMVVQSPKHESRILQAVLGNWQGSGIFTATSGAWVNVTDGEDVSLTGVGADRPIEVASPFVAGTVAANPTCVAPSAVHTLAAWYNPCAFMPAALGSYGTLGKNAMQGPGNWNFDANISRTFPISEKFKLDFKAEAFNALNHLEIGNPGGALFTGNLNIANPNATSRSLSAGYIGAGGAAYNPRILQLALKLTF